MTASNFFTLFILRMGIVPGIASIDILVPICYDLDIYLMKVGHFVC